jgi:hypothetical protein
MDVMEEIAEVILDIKDIRTKLPQTNRSLEIADICLKAAIEQLQEVTNKGD